MAGNQPPPDHGFVGDDFIEQMLAAQPGGYGGGGGGGGGLVGSSSLPMMGLQLGPTIRSSTSGGGVGLRSDGSNHSGGLMPLGLNLDHHHGFLRQQGGEGLVNINNTTTSSSNSATSAINLEGDGSGGMTSFFPGFGHLQAHSIRPSPPPQPLPHLHQAFQSQPTSVAVPAVQNPPSIRPRVRARRGQATDPHSIAERLRRERIAERMKALQELVPTANKTDRAAMLDEIVDYVKFLRLQVKVLSMSRLGAAGAVAQLVADVPPASIEGDRIEGVNDQPWEKWSNDGTEEQVAKLMEEDIGAAMQFLQSKALCIMPVSLASAIFRSHPPDPTTIVKHESNSSSQA